MKAARRRLLVVDVRHWMTNHEAGLGADGRSPNTVGDVFYGSKGYLAISDEDHGKYHSYLARNRRQGLPKKTSATTGPTSSTPCAVETRLT